MKRALSAFSYEGMIKASSRHHNVKIKNRVKQVGQHIESLINNGGYSQSDIAREIGVPRQSISYVIAGRRELSIPLALKLESFFNLRGGELLKKQAEDSIRNYKRKLKNELVRRLLEINAFWSYASVSAENVPDEELIEKVFIQLDLADIAKLFELYQRDYIRKVWKDKMVIRGDYLFNLNVMIALYYFNIKHPEKYLKRVEREHFKKLLNHA
ncbi:helix-turn-helix transcriptional regulator [uncultured Proteiniphilum sp.]|uniref:helix-turn-helix transcriptional regulator n=1 Tax=uncultured Proteiniphilum sp. TaxID=497637 RepID=UPI0026051E2A|nr:helix-turn-helix transcriptional regulator [uncultured Proteiniphilum sp.]